MNTEMNLKKLPVGKLKPAKYNPRKDLKPGDPAYEKIKRSLHDFGYVDPVIWNEVTGNIMFVMRFATVPMYLGFVVLGVAIVLGQTVFPAWFVVLTPLVTSFLGLAWMRVPQPARCILFGGWSNLVFTIMFAAMVLALRLQ